MKRRNFLKPLAVLGFVSFLGFDKIFFRKRDLVYCKIEDFWDTVKYKEEMEDGILQRNVYRIEDYPKCSLFRRINFNQIRNGDYFIVLSHKYDYLGPGMGYGFISKATEDARFFNDTFGLQIINISMEQCWTEGAFEKHMILSGADFATGSRHYKNGVRIS